MSDNGYTIYGLTKIYNQRKKINNYEVKFPKVIVSNFDGKKQELSKLKGKSFYLYIYTVNDDYLADNFLKWNEFFISHRKEKSRFITIGVGANEFMQDYKKFFINNPVAGAHLSISYPRALSFFDDLAISQTPIILKIDENYIIESHNIENDFKRDDKMPLEIYHGMAH